MSIKTIIPKKDSEPDGIRPAKTVAIFSALTATIAGALQKIFLMVMRLVGKEEKGATALSKSTAMAIDGAPASTWHLGSSAGAGGIIAALDDKRLPKYSEGDLPLDDSSMATFTDVHGDTYKLNPAVASQATFTDYWVEYGSDQPDPFTEAGTDVPL